MQCVLKAPSTEYWPVPSPKYQLTYWLTFPPRIGRYAVKCRLICWSHVSGYVDQHVVDVSADVTVNIPTVISTNLSTNTQPCICQYSVDMSVDIWLTQEQYVGWYSTDSSTSGMSAGHISIVCWWFTAHFSDQFLFNVMFFELSWSPPSLFKWSAPMNYEKYNQIFSLAGTTWIHGKWEMISLFQKENRKFFAFWSPKSFYYILVSTTSFCKWISSQPN